VSGRGKRRKGERRTHHKLPDRLDVGSFEVSGSVPSPAPNCEEGGRGRKRAEEWSGIPGVKKEESQYCSARYLFLERRKRAKREKRTKKNAP
jgi:hypothetical protein